MAANAPATAKLLPDPVAICAHISRLNTELKVARRLLRVAVDAYGCQPVGVAAHADEKPEVAEVSRDAR